VLLAAAWLHDTVEDTGIKLKDLSIEFPSEVVAVVNAVTDAGGTNRSEKKAATYPKIRRIPNAIILKLADRIANVEVGGKISKYRAEHPDFRKALYVAGIADDMWNYLDQMLAVPMAA
jgi:(p)ppGpp synthase/HD superfamily hydrolase